MRQHLFEIENINDEFGLIPSLIIFRTLYSNDTCTPTWDCVCPSFEMTTGGLCPEGYYCPQGSPAPVPCPGGEYCANSGLPTPTGKYQFYHGMLLV